MPTGTVWLGPVLKTVPLQRHPKNAVAAGAQALLNPKAKARVVRATLPDFSVQALSLERAPVTAYIGLGGNLGDAKATVASALVQLGTLRLTRCCKASSMYRTAPVDAFGPDYVNAVLEVSTTSEPEGILRELLRIEHELGRDRSPDKRWEPRTIDLDLLFVGAMVVSTPSLNLPHPEMAKRDFVIEPLAEIAGDFTHPVVGKSMTDLKEALLASGSERFVIRTFPFEG
jgi:2-amino-4-hydroxy-6-hydroxymethyldihydropteridine diphosphokinase